MKLHDLFTIYIYFLICCAFNETKNKEIRTLTIFLLFFHYLKRHKRENYFNDKIITTEH